MNQNWGITLPAFPSRTNLKSWNISLTLKMAKKVIVNLNLLKSSGLNCIPVVVLKKHEWTFMHTSWNLQNVSVLFSRLFLDFQTFKLTLVVPVFKNVGERSAAKNFGPIGLLSVVSKVFEKFVNNRNVDHLNKCGLISYFHYGFTLSRLMQIFSDRCNW